MMLLEMLACDKSAAMKLHMVKLQPDRFAPLKLLPSNTEPSIKAPAKLASASSTPLQFVNRISLLRKAISETCKVAPVRRAPPTNAPAILQAEKSHLVKLALSKMQLASCACTKLHDTEGGGWGVTVLQAAPCACHSPAVHSLKSAPSKTHLSKLELLMSSRANLAPLRFSPENTTPYKSE